MRNVPYNNRTSDKVLIEQYFEKSICEKCIIWFETMLCCEQGENWTVTFFIYVELTVCPSWIWIIIFNRVDKKLPQNKIKILFTLNDFFTISGG